MDNKQIKVFVYGSLMQGFHNSNVLGMHAKFIGTGYIRGYSMYDLGSFPGILYAGNCPKDKGIVYGELWEIDSKALVRVDRLEGTPHFYSRAACYVSLGSPALESDMFYDDRDQWRKQCAQEAYTYIYQCIRNRDRNNRVPCGDWRKHIKTIREIGIELAAARAD